VEVNDNVVLVKDINKNRPVETYMLFKQGPRRMLKVQHVKTSINIIQRPCRYWNPLECSEGPLETVEGFQPSRFGLPFLSTNDIIFDSVVEIENNEKKSTTARQALPS
jgi:hypothetical protein